LRHLHAHLLDAGALLLRRSRDLGHDVGHALDRGDYLVHRRTGLVHQLGAGVDRAGRIVDQLLDLLGSGRAALRLIALFAGDYREAPSLFAGTSGFDGRIERQDIGLERNAVDDAGDICNLL